MYIVLGLTILIILYLFCIWFAHIMAVMDEGVEYGWAGYRKFKREFLKYNWSDMEDGGVCDFESDYSMCSNNVVFFSDKGMILCTPFDYYMAVRCVARYKSKEKKKVKVVKLNVVKW